eukprot:CAMPEP_0172724158 /NCGR_PEP_ID=MMETSP1074-20121228/85297_1 /TAXON_ID=2916 /ORGANISM="Ceratium fusus, Strain PA161109" /LENGTH=147 /DNA_ID=CAMNT_0013550535 /DNA_START=74 /DNA_END=514 /DNA_ORIENTATION=+
MADAGVFEAIEQLQRAEAGEDVPGVQDLNDMLKKESGPMDHMFGKAFDDGPKHFYGRKTEDATPGDGKWHWEQKGEEVQVRFKPEHSLTKKDIAVTFKAQYIHITIKGEDIVKSPLFRPVVVDECTWCIVSGELQVMLTKQNETEHW